MWEKEKQLVKITAEAMPHPTHCPFTERQDSLLGFGAVGVIYHHSPSKASSHGLGRDELQLEKEAHANVIHPKAKPKRLLGSVTANCVCTRQVNPAFIKPYTKPLALQFRPGSSLQYFFCSPCSSTLPGFSGAADSPGEVYEAGFSSPWES